MLHCVLQEVFDDHREHLVRLRPRLGRDRCRQGGLGVDLSNRFDSLGRQIADIDGKPVPIGRERLFDLPGFLPEPGDVSGLASDEAGIVCQLPVQIVREVVGIPEDDVGLVTDVVAEYPV